MNILYVLLISHLINFTKQFHLLSGHYEKHFFLDKINEKAEQYLDVAMTYTLIELVKDNLEAWFVELYKNKPTNPVEKTEEILPKEMSKLVMLFTYFIIV